MWAEEINHLLARLESTYDPDHYRRLGPLLSDSAFQKVQIDQPTPTASTLEDPRVYTIACELEPCLCLLLHKSSNRNVLVFKVNLSTQVKEDPSWLVLMTVTNLVLVYLVVEGQH